MLRSVTDTILCAGLAVIAALDGLLSAPRSAAFPRQQPNPSAGHDNPSHLDTAAGVEENVEYGPTNLPELKLDVYEPASRGAQVSAAVILIHGGGWTAFDKGTMRDMGQFLARFGFVAFSIDYRLFHGSLNLWPAQLDDAQRAVRWVRANLARYEVNPERIAAFRHSAGAQLAALLGMEDTRENSDPALAKCSSRVQAVVDVSGPTDLTTERDPEGVQFLAQFLGGDFAGDAAAWRDASPVFHVTKGAAPFLLVHRTEDQDVAIAQAEELYARLEAADVPAPFVKVEDGHTFHAPDGRRQLAI